MLPETCSSSQHLLPEMQPPNPEVSPALQLRPQGPPVSPLVELGVVSQLGQGRAGEAVLLLS